MLIASFFDRLVRCGELTITSADGETRTFRGDESLVEVAIRLTDKKLEWEMLMDPQMRVPEAYVDGRLIIEKGDLRDFLLLAVVNNARYRGTVTARIIEQAGIWFRRLHQFNPATRSKRNVAHHYDLSGDLYELFLDSQRQYTCAYFNDEFDDIETAQRAKERHIAAKLMLQPGQRVVDLGCGWGALSLYLAKQFDIDVTGVTLSEEQHAYANRRAAELGIADRARFMLQDYRSVDGRFDRVVSIGMMEHVGLNHYDTLFEKVNDLMAEDGVGLIHCIGRASGPSANHRWLRKYIFPGSYAPALSEVMPSVERSGLWATDIEILRLHYAYTLKRWRELFHANWDEVAALYSEEFCRMWDVYLVATELFFTKQDGFIFHIQLAKDRDLVPITRDYITDFHRLSVHTDARAAE